MPAAYRATGAGTGGMPLVLREIAVSAGPAVRGIKGTNPGLVGAAIRRASEEAGLQNGYTDLGNNSQNEIEAASSGVAVVAQARETVQAGSLPDGSNTDSFKFATEEDVYQGWGGIHEWGNDE